MSDKFIQVTKEEFENFIDNYDSKLDVDTCHIFTPPLVTFNDFTKGVWSESVVAHIIWNENMKGDPSYNGEPDEYFILTTAYELTKKNQLTAS